MEEKDRLETIQGTIRRNEITISSFREKIEEFKKEDPNNKNISLFQRDIWDLENENRGLYDEFRGRSDQDDKSEGISGILLHITDVLEYIGLLYVDDYKGNYQKIKRLVSMIPEKDLEHHPIAKDRVDYLKALLRGEGEKHKSIDRPKKLPKDLF